MHPKAATLALAGCRVFVVGPNLSPRIGVDARPAEPMIGFDRIFLNWQISFFAHHVQYEPADWLAVSDNEWAALRDTLIAIFLERL
ncbi:hypothetical protein [Burkholderia cenocepacia]|uniref:hypothetical protein n=1 Tax=Burkholderia cenocepacia TaxID=95486 RepID=UPI002652135E|nr:hypothetical protein [Burkholderia cenocepacia]MDN7537052.1 hypothetical protein [Burkholderia cenocepacia]